MMMVLLCRRLCAAIVLCTLSTTGLAQLSPAGPGDPEAEKYIKKLIAFPETEGDANVRIFCEAIVKKNGKFWHSNCAVQNAWEPDFAQAILKATKKAVFTPAMIDGEPVDVVVYFQVEFLKNEKDGQVINLYLNSAVTENVEEYGPDHIGAQRVYVNDKWGPVCPKRAQWIIYALAHVDEQGMPSSVNLEHGGGIVPTGDCQSVLSDTIESSRFIPTFADGVAVPSSYIEPFAN